MRCFFYSDPHFGHKRILELAKRPFASIEEHDAELVRRYRETVTDRDKVFWCGDVAFGGAAYAKDIVSSLPGYKFLLLGNHDRSVNKMLDLGFNAVYSSHLTDIAGRHTIVSHYPPKGYVREDGFVDAKHLHLYPDMGPRTVVIHGHTHSTVRRQGTAINVCVEAWDYRPAPLSEIEKLVREAFNEEV